MTLLCSQSLWPSKIVAQSLEEEAEKFRAFAFASF